MTHGLENGDAGGFMVVVPVSGWKGREGEYPNGDYLRLNDGELEDGVGGPEKGLGVVGSTASSSSPSAASSSSCFPSSSSSSCCNRFCCSLWWWAKLLLLLAFLAALAAVFLKWIGPFFMDKEIIPVINWETETFSRPVLALLVFATIALFPTVLLPSSPSMWVAGMTFGYGYGFLLIFGAVTIGVSLPYFIGSLFHRQIQGLLERYPKKASIIRLAGEGSCFNQFRAVALIRVSPFPYIIYNYCAVATDVKYFPYLLGTLVGMVPEIFLTIYTGILIKTLADASHDHQVMSTPQIVLNVVGFSVTAATTVVVTTYAKRRLKELQRQEELLLR